MTATTWASADAPAATADLPSRSRGADRGEGDSVDRTMPQTAQDESATPSAAAATSSRGEAPAAPRVAATPPRRVSALVEGLQERGLAGGVGARRVARAERREREEEPRRSRKKTSSASSLSASAKRSRVGAGAAPSSMTRPTSDLVAGLGSRASPRTRSASAPGASDLLDPPDDDGRARVARAPRDDLRAWRAARREGAPVRGYEPLRRLDGVAARAEPGDEVRARGDVRVDGGEALEEPRRG